MGSSFSIKDRVRVIVGLNKSKTGVIIRQGGAANSRSPDERAPWTALELRWWIVKMDNTGEEQKFSHDEIEKIK